MKQTLSSQSLFDAIATLKDVKGVELFMLDLCTPAEISAFTERWTIAKLLHDGKLSYREISERTGASTTTVTRVARFLFHENNQGYKAVLDHLKEQGK